MWLVRLSYSAAATLAVLAACSGCGATFTKVPIDRLYEQLPDQKTNPHSGTIALKVHTASRRVTVYAEQSFSCDLLKQERRDVGHIVYRDGVPDPYPNVERKIVGRVESANEPCNIGPARNARIELEAGGQRVWLGNTDAAGNLDVDLADVMGTRHGITIPSGVTQGTLYAGGIQQGPVALNDWWKFELEYEADLADAEATLKRVLASDAATLETVAEAVDTIQKKNKSTLGDRRLKPVLDGLDKRMQKQWTAQPSPPAPPKPEPSGEVSMLALLELGLRLAVNVFGLLAAITGEALALVVDLIKKYPSEVCSAAQGVALSILAGKVDKRLGAAFPSLTPFLEGAALIGVVPSAIVFFLVKRGLGEARTEAIDDWLHSQCVGAVHALPSR